MKHVLTWLNLNSDLANWAQRALLVASLKYRPTPAQGPPFWWVDPAVATRGSDTPAVRRTRSLFLAIAKECRRAGTNLTVLVIGPAPFYTLKDGRSPLSEILASWSVEAPVIDLAAVLGTLPASASRSLVFARDGHLNEQGHAFTAEAAIGPLRAALGLSVGDRAEPAIADRMPGGAGVRK
jgi:hypothetical protein